MRKRDISLERFSDVRPVDEEPLYPGQYTPIDLALLYPNGVPNVMP